ncbi:PH and SEC7 domain-containing protein 2-like protein, partial [Dinothrombium tinctorium]
MSHNQRHLNSLSLSSSCESSNCSSPSPLEAGDEDGAAQKLQSTPRQTEKVSDFSCAKDVCLNQLSAIRVNDTNQSQLECNESPIRYPSFIVTQNKELSNLDETFEDASSPPPPFPNGPPPSTSSSENDSGSEDEIMDALNAYHYSPPKAVDTASASRLAKRLYNLEGFKKSDVSRHLSKNNDFSRAVAEEYLKFFDFSGDTLDGALRKFLGQFCLIGETQERERVLVHFSKRYLECNQGSFKSSDSVHTLTCALMLLNTDLHGENIGRRMTCGEFIENLAGLNEGDNFPRDVLRALYQSIKTQPLQWAMDDEADTNTATDKKSSGNGSPLSTNVVTVGHNPFLDVPNPNVATEYKKGYIMRKCCFDTSGKRTPFGKRGWKMFYATLRDLVLYLHKDEHGFRKNQLYESLHNSIRIHHALASRATDYTKKQFVFRLQTADGAEYLFQTSDARELQAWIEKINLVAASLSSPPLPSAVGSQTKKFQKPLLPVNHTKLSLRDQLIDHQTRKLKLEQELEELLTTHVEKGSSRRSLNEFAEKESYLQFELKRYQEYINLLQKKFQQTYGTQALDSIITVSNVSSAAKPSSKPLTTLSIGEELDDDNDEDGVPIIKRKSI